MRDGGVSWAGSVSVGSEQLVYAVELQTKIHTKVPNHEEGPYYGPIPYDPTIASQFHIYLSWVNACSA